MSNAFNNAAHGYDQINACAPLKATLFSSKKNKMKNKNLCIQFFKYHNQNHL
jgi:hypothetical protein